MTEKEKYYKMAEDWAEAYIADNPNPKKIYLKPGHIVNNDITYISVSLERLRFSEGREQQASYRRIREFKNIISKIN